MIGALPATLLLSLVTFVSASTRRSYPIPNYHLPRNYVALGDSYSSGVGSGNFLNQSRDGLDVKCVRQDGSYPSQLVSILPFGDRHHSFDFRSCAGDKLDDIDGQVAKYSALRRRYDLITLTIGGNDFSFGDIAEACVYQPRSANISNPQAICDAAFDQGFAALANSSTFDKFAEKIELIKSTLLAPQGKLFVTGYGKFFAEPVKGDACDHLSFFPVPQLAALNMTVESRQKANNLTEQVNAGIQKVLKHENDHAVTFFDFDKSFEGKRFCEPANAKDPIGSNNDNVFFNDLATVLKTPGVADVANQTPGLKVDISNLLQQVSVFHPKTQAYKPLVAQFAYKILSDAAHAHGVVVGPTKYCRKHKGIYTRNKSCDGFEVPEHCAAIVRNKEDPVVVCQNGDSFSPKHID